MKTGTFEELNQNEMLIIDGGDRARQTMVAANRASGQSLGSTKSAVNAQSAVTGTILSTVGVVCLAVPGLQAVGAVCTVAGAACSFAGFATM